MPNSTTIQVGSLMHSNTISTSIHIALLKECYVHQGYIIKIPRATMITCDFHILP